jgi:uncharacterized protein (TIGR03435 family)
MSHVPRLWIFVGVFLFAVIRLQAQPPGQKPPTFEVASVKTNASGSGGTGGRLAGASFAMTNETLWRLIGEAYADPQALPRFHIIGGPNWIDADRFDVEGVAAKPLDRPQAELMLRTLLAERFKLTVHTETRQLPVLALRRARRDGAFGPQLRRSDVDCAALRAAKTTPPPSSDGPRCVMQFGFGRSSADGLTITELATVGLSRIAGRNVIDETGLRGPFQWTLAWTPDNLPPRAPGTPADQPVTVNGIAIDPNGPSLFTAVEEQLGLKLEPTKGPVDVLVIDHVERPTPD